MPGITSKDSRNLTKEIYPTDACVNITGYSLRQGVCQPKTGSKRNPSVGGWFQQFWYAHTVEYHAAIRMNEAAPYVPIESCQDLLCETKAKQGAEQCVESTTFCLKYTYMHVCMYVCICVHVYVYICMCVCTYTCILRACVCVCVYAHICREYL